MVGLSVVLEGQNNVGSTSCKQAVIINKVPALVVMVDNNNNNHSTLLSPSSVRTVNVTSPSSSHHHHQNRGGYRYSPSWPAVFLDVCFLCQTKLLPGKDIYMYKGDRAFCSVECRCRQISLDEKAEADRSCDRYAPSTKASRCRKATGKQAGCFAH